MPANRLFSKKALKNLSSPEELDKLMVISSSSTWLALWAFIAFIVVVIIWGFIGKIQDTVQAQGIIINKSGKQDITPTSTGKIITLPIHIGDIVKKDQIIATISQSDLKIQLNEYQENLVNLKKNNKELITLAGPILDNKQINLDKKKLQLKNELIDNTHLYNSKKTIYNKMLKVENSGAFSKLRINTAADDVSTVKLEIDSLEQQINDIKTSKSDNILNYEQYKKKLNNDINNLINKINSIKHETNTHTNILAPADGTIIGIDVKIGSEVNQQTPIAKLSLSNLLDSDNTFLKLYVSPFSGEKINIGHLVRFSPSFVMEQEYGFMIGKVISINRYPISTAELQNDLSNKELVKLFQKNTSGAPIRVICSLERDPKTFNGYHWSTLSGPPLLIPQGSLGNAKITISEQAPAALVIPWIKKKTGI